VPKFEQPSAKSARNWCPTLEQSLRRRESILRKLDDADLAKIWRVMDGDREVMAVPVGAALRALMLNHWYHHRGQLSVYLRQVGVPVPSIYGPSADENPLPPPAVAGPPRRSDAGSACVAAWPADRPRRVPSRIKI
jgi:uncharacterized damage-inducible protein DinB